MRVRWRSAEVQDLTDFERQHFHPWFALGYGRFLQKKQIFTRQDILQKGLHYQGLTQLTSRQQLASEKYMSFIETTLYADPVITHFQLRNLLWATSTSNVYYLGNDHRELSHYSPFTKKISTLMKPNFFPSTITARGTLVVVGGMNGDYMFKHVNQEGPEKTGIITNDSTSGITNALSIVDSLSGGLNVMASSNDSAVRLFDAETFKLISRFPCEWAVNFSDMDVTRRLICAVGDAENCVVMDSTKGEVLETLAGHSRYCFACGFSPNGLLLFTGSEDCTVRVYDVRNLSRHLFTLDVLPQSTHAFKSAIRSIRFSNGSEVMAIAEDFESVHLYRMDSFSSSDPTNFDRQTIQVHGRISGISFTPDGNSLFIGVNEERYGLGGILEFESNSPSLSDLYF